MAWLSSFGGPQLHPSSYGFGGHAGPCVGRGHEECRWQADSEDDEAHEWPSRHTYGYEPQTQPRTRAEYAQRVADARARQRVRKEQEAERRREQLGYERALRQKQARRQQMQEEFARQQALQRQQQAGDDAAYQQELGRRRAAVEQQYNEQLHTRQQQQQQQRQWQMQRETEAAAHAQAAAAADSTRAAARAAKHQQHQQRRQQLEHVGTRTILTSCSNEMWVEVLDETERLPPYRTMPDNSFLVLDELVEA